jgi:aquaporin Z
VGTALFAADFPSADDNQAGVGFLGVALAFGLTLVAGIAAVGHISGGHFNPAVTLGLLAAGRTDARHVPGYWAPALASVPASRRSSAWPRYCCPCPCRG